MLDLVKSKLSQHEAFRADVLAGLAQRQKTLPSRWLYDQRGSELFEEITGLDEYYLTRTETAILRRHAGEMADLCGEGAVLLEYGAGAAIKSEILIDALRAPRMYAPIDIAADFLSQTVERIQDRFLDLRVRPIIADFTVDFDIPADVPARPRVAFFPGSTLGNLLPTDAVALLRRMREHVGERGKAIIGVDLRKDIQTLIAAYDDARGVTAAFNLNLLVRINRELNGDFALDAFAHEARWNERESAIEMHIVSSQGSGCLCCRPQLLIRGGRDHPHRDLPEVRRRRPHPRRAAVRLAGGQDLERPGRAFRGVRAPRRGLSVASGAHHFSLNGRASTSKLHAARSCLTRSAAIAATPAGSMKKSSERSVNRERVTGPPTTPSTTISAT